MHPFFKSVFGKVPMRLRRVWGWECRGAAHRTFSSIPTGKNPTAPELNYLTAKLAALLPFGKGADLLGELLPASAGTNAVTVRNRTMRVGRRLEKPVSRFSTCVWQSLTGRLSRIFENGTETSVGSTPLGKHPTTFRLSLTLGHTGSRLPLAWARTQCAVTASISAT
jgi:hypothetical protein